MATAIGGPRVLLRQLREVMAEPLASQERLDKIVDLIAVNMRADVCSFYVLRDDGALELFATHGLKVESVHLTTLRLGEGLVGDLLQVGEDNLARQIVDIELTGPAEALQALALLDGKDQAAGQRPIAIAHRGLLSSC